MILIGIPCRSIREGSLVRYGVLSTYTRALDLAGGAPVAIPLQLSEAGLRAIFDRLDGLLLAGGVDVDPREYGEEVAEFCGDIEAARDAAELTLTRWALAEDKPLFGICRGIQLMNVAAGGTLYQDLHVQRETPVYHQHRTGDPHNLLTHTVQLEPGSRTAQALGVTDLPVNSLHHQSVKDVAAGFKVVGRAPDQIIEAIEGTHDSFAVGVQFHPEWLVDDDPRMLGLFRAFVRACETSSSTAKDAESARP